MGITRKHRRMAEVKMNTIRTDMVFRTSASQIIPMKKTELSKALLMHQQDRNLHGKIFGGFIMREATELGWLCAHLFMGGSLPELLYIDEIMFVSPVEVGSMVNFKAKVVMAKAGLLHVTVHCDKVDPKNGNLKKTNVFRLVFRLEQDLDREIVPGDEQ